jgi:hypothetical protein
MKTGFRGTFVISWSQTKLDGMRAVPLQSLDVGTAWAWTGDATRVDGPADLLRLDEADGDASIRKRAAKMVRKLVGAALTDVKNLDDVEVDHPIRDSGAQDIQWIGARRMTGARLFAMPELRPIRIRAGAFNTDQPDQELLVSPNHRMLVKGAIARDLFNTPEVLVAAKDLVNGSSVVLDTQVKQVTYIHLMLPSHQIVLANGVETESFHPASTALSTIPEKDRARLAMVNDQLESDPNSYGGYARRILSKSEAAILMHQAA